MNEDGDEHRPGEAGRGVKPGTMSALLEELADLEEPTRDALEVALAPGVALGRFEIVRRIGRGGFGYVYEARDPELGRSVALKVVRGRGGAWLREERVRREAETAAQLSHANIVTLFELGHSEHGPYLVMELLHGETLAERLSRGPMPLPEAAGSRQRCRRASRTPTPRGSSIGTSSPRTCSSARTVG